LGRGRGGKKRQIRDHVVAEKIWWRYKGTVEKVYSSWEEQAHGGRCSYRDIGAKKKNVDSTLLSVSQKKGEARKGG